MTDQQGPCPVQVGTAAVAVDGCRRTGPAAGDDDEEQAGRDELRTQYSGTDRVVKFYVYNGTGTSLLRKANRLSVMPVISGAAAAILSANWHISEKVIRPPRESPMT